MPGASEKFNHSADNLTAICLVVFIQETQLDTLVSTSSFCLEISSDGSPHAVGWLSKMNGPSPDKHMVMELA